MPINEEDIKLLASERMTDAIDGGGRMTGNEIPDNVPGNLFPKISRVDSVYGRVNLRKLYVAVATATQDVYAGAHLILTAPPENERVSCCLFSTDDHFNLRANARDRIESYVVKGPRSLMHPIGTQLMGQRVVSAYQRLESPLPGVGEVYVLSVEPDDEAPGAFQYIRIMSVDHEERLFVYITADGKVAEMTRRALSLGISQPLAHDFPGEDPDPLRPGDTLMRDTSVADTAHYFGISPLADSANIGALTIKAGSIFAPLVPGVTTETPVVDVALSGALPTEATGTHIYYTTGSDSGIWKNLPGFSTTHFALGSESPDFHLGCAVKPGTFWLGVTVGGSISYTDDGVGGLLRYPGILAGSIDYNTGVFRIDDGDTWGAAYVNLYFVPSVEISQVAHTRQDEVTLATRGLNYIQTLSPLPAPGTGNVSYRAQGRWYTINDNGDGTMSGSGVGTINYTTGATVVTLEALPDVGSAVIWQWGSPSHYVIRTALTPPLARVQGTVSSGISPGTFSVTWLEGGAEKIATAGVNGDITGNGASGHVVHGTGEYFIEWTTYPDAGTQAELSYDKVTVVSEMFTGLLPAGGHVSFNLGTTPIRPGSLECRWEILKVHEYSDRKEIWTWSYSKPPVHAYTHEISEVSYTEIDARCRDDGAGHLGPSGEVIYNTGAVDLEVMPGAPANTRNMISHDWTYNGLSDTKFLTGIVNVTYVEDTAGPTLETVQIDIPHPRFVFGDLITDILVPGSLRFIWNGAIYQDLGNGLIYQNIDPVTGSGLLAGSVNYMERAVTLDDYVSGSGAVVIQSLLTRYGDWGIYDVQMRTPGSPLRSASFYIRATTMEGDLIEGTSDASGTINAAEMQGTIQQDMGVAAINFGAQVQESTLTDEQRADDWYDPADIEPDGSIWRPVRVLPSSLRYNSIVLATLPLDPAILGLDPVRLPSDGRVAIVRPGDVLVVHSTGEFALPDPVVASTQYDLPRGALQAAWVEDQNADRVPVDQYTADLVNGSVTTSAVLDLGDFTQPLIVRHRQEDMAVCTDAQIDGTVSLSAPLLHAYDTDAFVSSALLFGDVQARATNIFDQGTWSGEWSDTLIGSQANAEYDDLNYPPVVLNENAVKDRLRVHFITTTSFQLYSENLGQIATGNTSTDLAPVNPITGQPYFTLLAAGWGGGWSAGNQLRLNIEAGSAPAWVARTILQNAALTEDAIRLERRGDVD